MHPPHQKDSNTDGLDLKLWVLMIVRTYLPGEEKAGGWFEVMNTLILTYQLLKTANMPEAEV